MKHSISQPTQTDFAEIWKRTVLGDSQARCQLLQQVMPASEAPVC